MSDAEQLTVPALDDRPAPSGRAASARITRDALVRFAVRYAILWVLIALVIAAQLAYAKFLTVDNLKNMLTQNAETGVVAMGMTFVVIGGGFDLSVTGSFSFGAVLFAGLCMRSHLAVAPALALVLLAGAGLGLVNGLVVTKLGVNAFVTTLGTAFAYDGFAALYSHSAPISVFGVAGFDTLGAGRVLGLPVPIVVLIVLYLAGGVLLAKGAYGRKLYAVGGNLTAARLAGLRIDRIRAITFVVCGIAAAFAGAMLASNISTGQADQIPTIALDSIAAVVIGGTSLYGGEGAMWRTAVGLLILATMSSLFSSLAISTPVQNVIEGAVVIAAVALEAYTRKQGAGWGVAQSQRTSSAGQAGTVPEQAAPVR